MFLSGGGSALFIRDGVIYNSTRSRFIEKVAGGPRVPQLAHK